MTPREGGGLRRTRRLRDWEARLNALLERVRREPYAWGRHDCMRFCAAAVEAVTGVDLSRGRRGRYRSEIGALRHLRRLGVATPAELLDSLLPPRAPAFARRGDLVAGEDGIPGVAIGGGKAAFAGPEGLATEPLAACTRAWTVGEA